MTRRVGIHEFPTDLKLNTGCVCGQSLVLVVGFIMGDDDEWKKLAIEDKVVHKVGMLNVFSPQLNY